MLDPVVMTTPTTRASNADDPPEFQFFLASNEESRKRIGAKKELCLSNDQFVKKEEGKEGSAWFLGKGRETATSSSSFLPCCEEDTIRYWDRMGNAKRKGNGKPQGWMSCCNSAPL